MLALGAICLVVPDAWTDALGAAILAAVLLIQTKKAARSGAGRHPGDADSAASGQASASAKPAADDATRRRAESSDPPACLP